MPAQCRYFYGPLHMSYKWLADLLIKKLIGDQLKFCCDHICKENSKEKFPLKAMVQNSHIPKHCQSDRSEPYEGHSDTSKLES